MPELDDKIIKKDSILLARNTPVALVIGAAGFIGSHLTENLLSKNIQVIGVDNFNTGLREYLEEASKDKDFHLINNSAEYLDLDIPRLDYLFITAGDGWSLSKVLKIAKEYKSKLVFISSVDLYDEKRSDAFHWYKQAESHIANFSKEHHLNARVVRLATIYGPRMHFREDDPMVSLIEAATQGELQKESTALEFSSRALFIDDGVELIVKSMFIGSTALKIFDGAHDPLKVSEIKQVLLDPNWYENKGFDPSELPPWPTPNLEKTKSELHWHPKVGLVKGLKETTNYFKNHEVRKIHQQPSFKIEKRFYQEQEEEEFLEKETNKSKTEKRKKVKFPSQKLGFLMALILIIYALVVPAISLVYGTLTFQSDLLKAQEYLKKGEYDQSLNSIRKAEQSTIYLDKLSNSLEMLGEIEVVKKYIEGMDNIILLSSLGTKGAEHAILGAKALDDSLKTVTGELNQDSEQFFSKSLVEFSLADEKFSKIEAYLGNDNFKTNLVPILGGKDLNKNLQTLSKLSKQGRVIALLLPELIAASGKKSYLILIQDHHELRPGGGVILAYGRIDFEEGKLKKIEIKDSFEIDNKLNVLVEPPKEIADNLGQRSLLLKDSNWEADFPTSAKGMEWFFNQQTGSRVNGVIALDAVVLQQLLQVVGPIKLADFNEAVSSDNLFSTMINHSNPSPQSQTLLTSLTSELFNKIFFLPDAKWSLLGAALGKSLEEKHMTLYLSDPKIFSYVVSQNWAGLVPRPASKGEEGILTDFLLPVEANLGNNKANYYLERQYNLQTTIGEDDQISNRLRISYTNSSPTDVYPAGLYKNRMRIYLPFGSKLIKASWGEQDITKDVSSLSDYGRTAFTVLLELAPKMSNTLVVDYQLPTNLEFKDNQAIYKLDVIKQAGTMKDSFEWRVLHPSTYKMISTDQIITSDLSTNKSFEISFQK